MKLTSRGFTLVELMIVIAIIGILAASLFPSLTSYLKRSRDAARSASLKDISTAIGAYYSDKEAYPTSTNPVTGTGCVPTTINSSYMESGVPTDPTANRANGCVVMGKYGYAAGTSAGNSPQFILLSTFENINGGNYSGVIATGGLFWNGTFDSGDRTILDTGTNVSKGSGSGYVIYK